MHAEKINKMAHSHWEMQAISILPDICMQFAGVDFPDPRAFCSDSVPGVTVLLSVYRAGRTI
jgi:hypothetical protein